MRLRCLSLPLVAFGAACVEPVTPPRPLSVTPTSVQLFTGDTIRIAINDERARVLWHSSAPTVASVSSSGLVTAISRGIAAVWAVRGADSAAASVQVTTMICISDPRIGPSQAELTPGDTLRVEAWGGSCAPQTDAFVWSSADSSIAVAAARNATAGRSAALVTGRRRGQVVITARLRNDSTVSVAMALTVRAPDR